MSRPIYDPHQQRFARPEHEAFAPVSSGPSFGQWMLILFVTVLVSAVTTLGVMYVVLSHHDSGWPDHEYEEWEEYEEWDDEDWHNEEWHNEPPGRPHHDNEHDEDGPTMAPDSGEPEGGDSGGMAPGEAEGR